METQLSKWRSAPECRDHWSGLRYTDGVETLLDEANAGWLVNVIGILQDKARRDPRLREFQVWEFFGSVDRKIAIVCSRDSEDVAFRLTFGRIEFPLAYLRLHVTLGIVCLPREHRAILGSQFQRNEPRRSHVLTIERHGKFWSLKEDGALLCVAVYKKGANAVKTRIEELIEQGESFKKGSDLCQK